MEAWDPVRITGLPRSSCFGGVGVVVSSDETLYAPSYAYVYVGERLEGRGTTTTTKATTKLTSMNDSAEAE